MTKNIAQRIEEKLIFLRCEREILEKDMAMSPAKYKHKHKHRG